MTYQECLWEKARLIRSICSSRRDWSGISAGMDRIRQECLQERAGLARIHFGVQFKLISDVLVNHSRIMGPAK